MSKITDPSSNRPCPQVAKRKEATEAYSTRSSNPKASVRMSKIHAFSNFPTRTSNPGDLNNVAPPLLSSPLPTSRRSHFGRIVRWKRTWNPSCCLRVHRKSPRLTHIHTKGQIHSKDSGQQRGTAESNKSRRSIKDNWITLT